MTLTSDDLESDIVVNDSSTLTNTTIWFVAALSLIVDVRTYGRTDVRTDMYCSDGRTFLPGLLGHLYDLKRPESMHLFSPYTVAAKHQGWKIHRPAYCFDSVIVTFIGQSILRKILKFVATRWHLLRLKCTKLDFGKGSVPDPTGELTVLPRLPIAGFKGFYFQGTGRG